MSNVSCGVVQPVVSGSDANLVSGLTKPKPHDRDQHGDVCVLFGRE